MENILIEFIGPFKFFGKEKSTFSGDNKCSPGIYLWTFKTIKGYMIHYIGQTTKFAIRQKEHLINILGLNYGIFDADEAKNGNQKIIWKGLWRDKNNVSLENALKDIYLDKKKEILEYIESIDIFFAELDGTNKLREHVEGSIGWNLRNNHKEFKTLYPDDNHIGISNKMNCKLFIINNHNILGIDNELEI
jgi:hypothetical protein